MEYTEATKFFKSKDEDHDLWLLFNRARYAVYRVREKELQRYGITPEQANLLLNVVAMGNKAYPAKLSQLLLRQPHSMSELLGRMAKSGLIKKGKDLDFKKRVRVMITEKGQRAYELSTGRGPIHRIMGALSEAEKKEFRRYLEKIYAQALREMKAEFDNLST